MKLGDVLTMRNGKTVEVLNTDAEGRLILADALSYAVEQKPATDPRPGHAHRRVHRRARDEDRRPLQQRRLASPTAVSAACASRPANGPGGCPLDDDFQELLKSTVADLKNVGGKWGGAITAAKFLQQFVGDAPWVHLDIAGPSWADSDGATRDAGGTGCFVRTLVDLVESGSESGVPGAHRARGN